MAAPGSFLPSLGFGLSTQRHLHRGQGWLHAHHSPLSDASSQHWGFCSSSSLEFHPPCAAYLPQVGHEPLQEDGRSPARQLHHPPRVLLRGLLCPGVLKTKGGFSVKPLWANCCCQHLSLGQSLERGHGNKIQQPLPWDKSGGPVPKPKHAGEALGAQWLHQKEKQQPYRALGRVCFHQTIPTRR